MVTGALPVPCSLCNIVNNEGSPDVEKDLSSYVREVLGISAFPQILKVVAAVRGLRAFCNANVNEEVMRTSGLF